MSWELIVTASWEMEGPFKWGQSDSKSVSNSFYKAVSVIHFWQAYAYFMWFTLRETFQVLIKRQASPNLLESAKQKVETDLSQRDYISLDKTTLSLHLSSFVSLFLGFFLPMFQHLNTFGAEVESEEMTPFPSRCSLGSLGWFVIFFLTW